jgi:hypothetical protein
MHTTDRCPTRTEGPEVKMSRSRLLRSPLALGVLLGMLAPIGLGQCTPDNALLDAVLRQARNNTQPVARAGDDQVAAQGTTVALDGTHSYDPDGDELKFHWRVVQKPEASTLGDAPFTANLDRNSGFSSFTPDAVGTWIIGLKVEDDYQPVTSTSASDYLIVRVESSLQRPIADAGPNQSVLEGSQVCFDGVASHDPAGLPLTYVWTLVSAPAISDLTTADLTPSGTTACLVPDAPGAYSVALVVSNGTSESDPDFAFLSAGSTNQGPQAVAQVTSAYACAWVTFDGTTSTDPEGDTLSYDWAVLLAPPGSVVPLGASAFDDPHSATPRFFADIPGQYTAQLVVTDGEAWSQPVFLEFHAALKPSNQPPVVVVSPDAYFFASGPACSTDAYGNCMNCPNCPGQHAPVDAMGTYDPDGDTFQITWDVLTGPSNTNLNPELGEESEVTIPGPPGSCTSSVQTVEVQVRATAMDCSGGVGTGVVTFVYDCG